MLVLRRKPSETIYIGDDIVVKLIRTDLGSAKIGIEAPRNRRVQEMDGRVHPPNPCFLVVAKL